ncbi:MAG: ubiquinone/menaquinone biosynthesis C-methylase UbiE [Chlamydiales bacterium]|jgi:ubiquinone/menaquinone biosynthesis C-methylase UbiE
MKTNWDYTKLAMSYLKRPQYAETAIDQLIELVGTTEGARVCDVGAGVGHLTIPLLKKNFYVDAVEPNDEMRRLGIEQTSSYSTVNWSAGSGEETGKNSKNYDLVTFGSSFNVTDREKALKETARILKRKGWFACMWNHRDLKDPIQASIEKIISKHLRDYHYGVRREDQSDIIKKMGLFEEAVKMEGMVIHFQSVADCLEAWCSHATLERQAGGKFNAIIGDIKEMLYRECSEDLSIPYTTRIWAAKIKK